jgi:hypothetical protein
MPPQTQECTSDQKNDLFGAAIRRFYWRFGAE